MMASSAAGDVQRGPVQALHEILASSAHNVRVCAQQVLDIRHISESPVYGMILRRPHAFLDFIKTQMLFSGVPSLQLSGGRLVPRGRGDPGLDQGPPPTSRTPLASCTSTPERTAPACSAGSPPTRTGRLPHTRAIALAGRRAVLGRARAGARPRRDSTGAWSSSSAPAGLSSPSTARASAGTTTGPRSAPGPPPRAAGPSRRTGTR